MSEPRELIEVDGWLTDDPEELRRYLSGAMNRWTFADQLRVDARSWKPWAFWSLGALAFAVGTVMKSLPTVLLGGLVWVTYLRMLIPVVRGRQRTQLFEAIVRFDGVHPLVPSIATGAFTEEAGSRKGGAMLPAWAVDATRHPDGHHHVLIAFQPGAQFSHVVGVRPTGYRPAPSPT